MHTYFIFLLIIFNVLKMLYLADKSAENFVFFVPMVKNKSKYGKSGWRDVDFSSFWQHYAKVQEWVRVESECRKNAMDDWEWCRAEKECISLLSLATAHLGSELNTAPGSVVSADDGVANANRTAKRAEHGQYGHRIVPDAAVVGPLNELDSRSINLSPSASTKRKNWHKKLKQQQQKWMMNHQQQDKMEVDDEQLEHDGMEKDEQSMDEKMRAFRQTTLEHRKQWEQKKREEKQKQRKRRDSEEYFDASKMNFKATRQQIDHRPHQLSKKPCSSSAVAGAGLNDGVVGGNGNLAMRAREYRRQGLYGPDGVDKLDVFEAQLHAHFETEFAKYTPNTWPNIPFRF